MGETEASVMSDRVWILLGLALFLVLMTFPIWFTQVAGGDTSLPERSEWLELPKDSTECIEDTEYMVANHMEILYAWRDEVVREGDKEDYESKTLNSEKTYAKSLTRTCLKCHTSRETFCNKCHDYANVQPRCWNCHVEPKGD